MTTEEHLQNNSNAVPLSLLAAGTAYNGNGATVLSEKEDNLEQKEETYNFFESSC